MANNPAEAIKSRYAIAGALWTLAVAAVYGWIDWNNIPEQRLGQGAINVGTIAAIVPIFTLIAVVIGRARPRLGKILLWVNIVFLLGVSILTMMGGLGIFLLPAPLALGYAVMWNDA